VTFEWTEDRTLPVDEARELTEAELAIVERLHREIEKGIIYVGLPPHEFPLGFPPAPRRRDEFPQS
jgi:hypothetical protein